MNADERRFKSREREGAPGSMHARRTRSLTVAALGALVLILSAGCSSRSAVPASHSAFAETSAIQVELPRAPMRSGSTAESARPSQTDRSPARRDSSYAVAKPWRFAGAEGRVIETRHYRIYTTATRSDFLSRLPVFYEAALAHYTSVLGDLPQPEQPLTTYLFQTRSQWQEKTAQVLPEQAGIFGSLGRGGFTTGGKAVLYYIDWPRSRHSADTFAIAAHEGWHQYTQTTFRHHLPIWLEEGIATYMEGLRLGPDGSPVFEPWRNRERRAALFEAVRSESLIPLGELVQRSPQSFLETGKNRLLTYYGQVWALTRFLVEWEDGYYRDSLEEVLQDAAAGRLAGRLGSSGAITGQRRRTMAATTRSGPWLILEYFNSDFDEFEKQYQSYMRTLLQRGR